MGEDDAAVDSPSWRPVRLDGADAPPPGATLVRVSAVDASTSSGGWLAVTAPSTQRWTAVRDALPADRTVALTWQFAFLYPNLHKPTQGQGINEPSTAAVMWGTSPLAIDSENVYAVSRGGLFAQSVRESSVVELPTRLRHFPTAGAGQVYLLPPVRAGRRGLPARPRVAGGLGLHPGAEHHVLDAGRPGLIRAGRPGQARRSTNTDDSPLTRAQQESAAERNWAEGGAA